MKIKPEYFEKYGKETPDILFLPFLFDRNNFLHYRPDSTWLRILWGEEQRRVLREEQFEFVLLWVHADHHSRCHWHRGTAGSVSVCPCYIICYHTVSVSVCPRYIMSYCLSVSLSMQHYVILFQCQSVHATLCHTVSVSVCPCYIMSNFFNVSLYTLHNMLSYCVSVSLSTLHYVILFQCQSVHATLCQTVSVSVCTRYIICCHTVSVSVSLCSPCNMLVFPRYIICRHTVSVSVYPGFIIWCHTVLVSVCPRFIIWCHTVLVSVCPRYIMSYCVSVSQSMLHHVILLQC